MSLVDPVLGDVTFLVSLAVICFAVLIVYPALWIAWRRIQLWRAKRHVDRIFEEYRAARERPRHELVQTIVEQKRKAWR